MNNDKEEIKLLNAIYDTFPEVADDLDFTLKKNWEYEPHERNEMWTGLIERFSQITTDAISRGDDNTARKYLLFMEGQYLSGGVDLKKAVDTYYVESLLWNIKGTKRKARGWSLIPETLQELYVAFWGEPTKKNKYP